MALNFDLDVDEANIVLRGLGKLPYEEVASTIGKIKTQGEAQLVKREPVAESAPSGPQQLNG